MNPLVRLVFFNPVMNYAVWSIRRYIRRVAQLVPAGTTLLDVGAGECQYKPFFSHARYLSTDWCGTTDHHRYSAGIDYICPADELPLANEQVDFVLCTQVLEHVRYPEKVIQELGRVLKPGGLLFLTVPQSWEEHEQPYDFHRFTQFALRAYADDHGFDVVEIRPQGGRFLVIGFFLAWSLPTLFKNTFGQPGFLFAVVAFFPLNFLIALLFFLLDPLDRKREFTMNYECIFRKK
ncbi:bifunctional 2-polyprenyl-6-hydroxyphenol methylase/3-demethylubiquinol 3-O-methyltransferase UbiG [Larkinella sp. C7]|jgi:SAM-dependent methyltransferase|uniref:class I SAM-dependent methyltransferase n=1 Tax=Larkinella sp. C7 TaxID=2576607 RepID=UPI00111103E3|nr:class I SAM-dependent methyltransferase [Larkinella sp. C7]